MKKTLIALALLGLTASAAQAQSSITIYGAVDVGLAHDNNGTTSLNRMDTSNLNGSRLGFKGTEDLGGGLSAIFQFENGFNTDTGAQADATRLFNRQAYIGMSGAFGAIKLGRQGNPVYMNSDSFDPFADSLAGDSARLFSYNGARTDNLITYRYTANGFRGELQYGLGESSVGSAAGRTVAGWFGYKKNAVDVILTHQNIRNVLGTNSTRMTLLGGNYNFGPVKAFATYAWEKGVTSTDGVTPLDQRDALVGVIVPVTASGNFMASYIRKTDKLVADKNANQVAIGYIHDMSKRTALYASYGQTRNDTKASYRVTTAGNTDKLLNVGIRHWF